MKTVDLALAASRFFQTTHLLAVLALSVTVTGCSAAEQMGDEPVGNSDDGSAEELPPAVRARPKKELVASTPKRRPVHTLPSGGGRTIPECDGKGDDGANCSEHGASEGSRCAEGDDDAECEGEHGHHGASEGGECDERGREGEGGSDDDDCERHEERGDDDCARRERGFEPSRDTNR